MKFTNPPHWRLNCAQWRDGPSRRRHGEAAHARQAEVRGNADERRRRVRAYCAEHHCSEAEAERELFDGDEPC
jgi:hypothetical protein